MALLNEFDAILNSDSELRYYYADSLNWINEQKSRMSVDKVRVGIIGVTSSGKSTLLNAIMGVDILPCAVVPSTGQIISCSYGDKVSATIRFKDGTEKVIEGSALTQESLMEYSDQRSNPYNVRNVEDIEIRTPYYQMGDRVVLIDSPGLDAYGLEAAEQITLETLVPTIDMCVFVTTMKANNDKKLAEVLDTVSRYNCPLLIVQNMLDTLKPNPRGDKSCEQKARESYRRVERIIEQSSIQDKGRVKIVQISAEYAKKWRLAVNRNEKAPISEKQYLLSKYDNFIKIMNDFLEEHVLGEGNRLKVEDVEEYIEKVIRELKPHCTRNGSGEDESFKYENLREEVKSFVHTLEDRYYEISKAYSKDAKEIKADVQSTGFSWNVDSYVNKTNRVVHQVGLDILDIIKSGNEYLTNIAAQLNMSSRDLLLAPELIRYNDIIVETKSGANTSKGKSGLGGFFGKLRGGASKDNVVGYRGDSANVSKIDVDANRRRIIARLGEAIYRYDEQFERWNMSVKGAVAKIMHAIDVAERAYNARKNADAQKSRLYKVYDDLEKLQKKITQNAGMETDKKILRIEAPHSIDSHIGIVEMSPVSSEIIRMSRGAVRRQHNEILKQFILKENLSDATPVIVGWDTESIEDLIWQLGLSDAMVADLSKDEYKELPIPGRRCFFILVNAIQFGAARKQINELQLEDILTSEDFVFWVVQDAEELMNCDNLVEGLRCMVELKKNDSYKFKSIIWLVHENPVYNIVFLEHQYQASNLLRDDGVFLRQIKEKFGVYCDDAVMETINEIIKRVHV